MYHTDLPFGFYLHLFIYCDFGLMYQLTLPNTIWLPLDIRRALYDIRISPRFFSKMFLFLSDRLSPACAGLAPYNIVGLYKAASTSHYVK